MVGPVVAIVCALIAFTDMHVGQGRVGGKGMAVAGLVLGIVGLLLNIAFGVAIYFMVRYTMKMIEATAKFENAVEALKSGDLDGATDLLAGPQSPPKAELKARIREAAAELGSIDRYELVRTDSSGTTGFRNVQMTMTWNLYGKQGDGHLTLDLWFDGDDWYVRDLRFGPGTVAPSTRRNWR